MKYGLKIAAFIVLLLSALPLWGGPVCSVCGRRIPAGRYYQTADRRAVCSRKCLQTLLPVCSVCGKRLEEGYLQDNQQRIFCSEKCLQTTLPVCSVCGRRLTDRSLQDKNGRVYCSEKCALTSCPVCSFCGRHSAEWSKLPDGTVLCKNCRTLPRCAACTRPMPADTPPLRDGRRTCGSCRRDGIFNAAAARREFDAVRRELREKFGLYVPGEIDFQLVDLPSLQARSESRGQGEMGVCRHQVQAVMRGKKEVRRSYRREISILYGLPPARFRAVAAHELAHDWFNMTIEGKLPPAVVEGWAELVAWSYCRNRGETEQLSLIENNGVDLYRNGFKSMRRRLTLPADPQKIRDFFLAMHPQPLLPAP